MKEKHFTAVVYCHLVLMVVFILLSAVNIVGLFEGDKPEKINGALLNATNIIGLGCGIWYLIKRYSKKVSIYYKAFIFFIIVSNIIYLVRGIKLRGTHDVVILCIKISVLLVLAFWKDLGRTATWGTWGVLLAIDLLYWIPFGSYDFSLTIVVFDTWAKLIIDGTIALAIRGKYIDKKNRGTT